jgi:hypothetical protein
VPGSPPFGDTFLDELSAPVFATSTTNTISGNIVSAVYENSGGTLDFFYQFQFDGSTNVTIDNTSMQSFTGIPDVAVAQSSADLDDPGGLFDAPTSTGSFSSANRPNADGNGINTTLLTGVTGDQSSYVFIIRTGALTFQDTGSVSVQGGGISAFTPADSTIAPIGIRGTPAAPEPGSLPLVAVAALATCILGCPMLLARNRQGGSYMQL